MNVTGTLIACGSAFKRLNRDHRRVDAVGEPRSQSLHGRVGRCPFPDAGVTESQGAPLTLAVQSGDPPVKLSATFASELCVAPSIGSVSDAGLTANAAGAAAGGPE